MRQDKTYSYEVKVVWSGSISGKNKEEAKDKVKESMIDEFNFEPEDSEITIK